MDDGLCSPVSHEDILWEKVCPSESLAQLFALTRGAACEDISCLATLFEICGRALDSEPTVKGDHRCQRQEAV